MNDALNKLFSDLYGFVPSKTLHPLLNSPPLLQDDSVPEDYINFLHLCFSPAFSSKRHNLLQCPEAERTGPKFKLKTLYVTGEAQLQNNYLDISLQI